MAKILIIEDNEPNLRLVQYLLEHAGHEVLAAGGGGAGIELAVEHRPDLVLCDVNMPDVDGFQVLDYLRRKLDDVMPVVAVTALAMEGDRKRILEYGFDGYIPKPIKPSTFVAQIDSFLEQPVAAPRSQPAAPMHHERTR